MTFSDAARSIAEAVALVIAFLLATRIVAGGKALRGLLASKTTAARITPERVQLLAVTLLLAGWYLFRVLAARGNSIPPISNLCIWAFGISSAIYAAGNAVRTFGNQDNRNRETKGEWR
jgi:hypothetical protein